MSSALTSSACKVTINLICIYRHQEISVSQFFEDLDNLLNTQSSIADTFLLTGDYNFHYEKSDSKNVEALADKIVEAGGKKRMDKPRYYYPGEKPYRMIYMEDPFGNILEIYSHSYELIYSSGAYDW